MNLISCKSCGVLIDKDRLSIPDELEDDEGCINRLVADYNQDTKSYEAYVRCPVCKSQIFFGM